jgi:DNA-binding transcriptional MerR regulator
MKPLTQPLFTVSVASSLVGVSPSTLRRWEALGLLAPVREPRSRRRLYAWSDIERAQQIRYLVLRRRVPLRSVRPHLRLLAAREASRGVQILPARAGTPLAPRVALALAR